MKQAKNKKVIILKNKKATVIKKADGETNDEKAVRNKVARVSINARKRAFSKNASVTIIRNGKIIRIAADRKERVLREIPKKQIHVDINKIIRIK